MIKVRRVYDPGGSKEPSFLVDRLWPRGIKKEDLKLNGWLKEVAPSNALRRWFGHQPKKWREFLRRYFEELDSKSEAWRTLVEAARRGEVTLLYSARDREYNNAVALRMYLEPRLKKE